MEHRWGTRKSTDIRIRFISAPAKIGTGRVTNISLSGAFLETTANLRLLSVVYLTCISARGVRRKTGMAACVVRRGDRGVGLEWCDSYAERVSVDSRMALLAGEAVSERAMQPQSREAVSMETMPQWVKQKS